MEFDNCKKCGKIIEKTDDFQLCSSCQVVDKQNFDKVKEYIFSNPGAKIDDIADALGFSYRQIIRYLNEGKLVSSDK